jgi:hypothetical protein
MPLPETMELQTSSSKQWSLIPPDIYQAEITEIEYKEVDNMYKREVTDPDKKQVMEFEFTIVEDGPHYGRKFWKKMSPTKPVPGSNGKVSWIWRIASAIAGHPITKDEGEKYITSDINGFIHQQVRIGVIEKLKQDGQTLKNDIESLFHAKTQLPPFDPTKVQTNLVEDEEDEVEGSQQPQSGLEKARAVASSLPGGNRPTTGQIEANSAYSDDEVDVEDIPF